MSEGPWIRFFPSDWLAGTRGMTAAETGVYITLIAMMYERGEPLQHDIQRLARLCGTTTASLKRTIETLVEAGKLRMVNGGIWNDRVEQEAVHRREKSTFAKEAAETRWKIREENQRRRDADAMQTQCERNANQKPEPEKRIDAIASIAREPAKSIDAEFHAEFWPRYPNKVGKPKALQAYRTARRKVDARTILAGLDRYIRNKPPDRQWLNPATFLNQARWDDEPAEIRRETPHDRQSPHSAMFEALAGLARGPDDPGRDSGDVLRLPDASNGPGGVSSQGGALFRDDGGVLPFRRPAGDIVLDGPPAFGGERELRLSAVASATGAPRADRG